MRALPALLLAIAFPVLSQTAAPAKKKVRAQPPVPAAAPVASPATAWPIGSLAVTGSRTYPADQILQVAGLRIGDMAGQKEFDAARDRLLSTGAFETVGYKFEPHAAERKYAATFEVLEIAQVYPFHTEELPLTQSDVDTWLALREPLYAPKMPATKQMLERYSRHIEELLEKKGKPVKVLGKLTPEPGADLAVIFRPASLPSVAEVYFKGNQSIDSKKLQKAVTGAAIGSIYTERRFRQILDASLKPLYEEQGRVAVTFPKFETAPAKNVDGIAVTAEVHEGAVYKIRRIELAGVENRADLYRVGKFKTDIPANFVVINEGIDAVIRRLRKDGFVHAASESSRTLDEKTTTLDLTITLEPGPRFAMGKLTITGLDIQTEPFVRKLWALQEGQPFNADYPDFFMAKIREGNYFENLGETKTKVNLDEKNRIAAVTLEFGKGVALPAIGPDAEKKPPQPY